MVIDLNFAPRQTSTLSAISVAGFKSLIHEQTLHISPLTILAGANSSGKSSIMQPLLLMKQTLESPYDPGVFLLDGPNVRFTSSQQILSRPKINNGIFSITIHDRYKSTTLEYSENSDFGLNINRVTLKEKDSTSFTLSEMTTIEDVSAYLRSVRSYLHVTDITDINFTIIKSRISLDLTAKFNSIFGCKKTTMSITTNFFDAEDEITNIIHLPGLRRNPERSYKTSGVGNKYSGTFENYVASIIRIWQQNRSDNIITICNHLQYVGLTSIISSTALDATQVELKVGRLPYSSTDGDSDLVNIADVGVGVSQVLPVLVALLAAAPGQLVYIEQPEIHLHPLAQYKLAAIIAEASKRGVLVVIETHSDILIRGVQTLVAKGELDPAIVKLHWFSRSPEDGSTTVTCAELDETGSFGDWPQDFDTTALLTEKAYLDAVEERLSRNEK